MQALPLPRRAARHTLQDNESGCPRDNARERAEMPAIPTSNAPLSRHAMAYVLAGGRGSRLHEMTDARAKPAVYFGGKSRIIDFALSNALNSGLRRLAVATQYTAHSLIQNIDIIESYAPQHIILLAGDHVYKMDYEPMLQQHVQQGADVTIGCLEVPRMEATAFGVMHVDAEDRLIDFLEKPADPPGIPDRPDMALASMGIYVFETGFLFSQLRRDAADPHSARDFGRDIIPYIVKHGSAVAHRFSRSCVRSNYESEAYWRDVGTVDAYWAANIDLTDVVPALDLYDQDWPIWTYGEITPPAKFVHNDDGRRGMAVDSLVSGGCIISGSRVNRSLLFTGVHVHSYGCLDNAVVMPYVSVGRGARLTNVVVDRGVIIPDRLVVGEDPALDAQRFRRTPKGVCLITQAMIDQLPG